jgi:hypothetical protein
MAITTIEHRARVKSEIQSAALLRVYRFVSINRNEVLAPAFQTEHSDISRKRLHVFQIIANLTLVCGSKAGRM